MYHFCTYFDRRYLPRGLALYRSLQRNCPAFTLWVLCMDRACHDALARMKLPAVRPISLDEFEQGDAALLAAKQNRLPIEYYFTCTPSLPLFVLDRHAEVGLITYLDADLHFHADPTPLFDEMGNHSIAIIAHRFPPQLCGLERNGIYNVGWLAFRRDERGVACLRWWRERCLEWCYDRAEEGRYADQKYLDDWPTRFTGVTVLQHKGANLAPWNLSNYTVRQANGTFWVDDQPLIFFHFHGLKQLSENVYQINQAHYHMRVSKMVRYGLYRPYIEAVLKENRQIPDDSAAKENVVLRASHSGQRGSMGERIGSCLRIVRSLLIRDYIFVMGGRAI